jgi:hypothetical protein
VKAITLEESSRMVKRRTITYKDLEVLAQQGWEISLKKGRHPKRYYGLCLPDLSQIRVYMPAHNSKREIALTILHECYHALEGLNGFKRVEEEEINTIIKETLRKRPKIEYFTKQLFSLDY